MKEKKKVINIAGLLLDWSSLIFLRYSKLFLFMRFCKKVLLNQFLKQFEFLQAVLYKKTESIVIVSFNIQILLFMGIFLLLILKKINWILC